MNRPAYLTLLLVAACSNSPTATNSPPPPPPPATQLAFSSQPSSTAAGTAIAPAVGVVIEDASGNVVPSFGGSVTVALATNPGSGSLAGTTTVAAVNGVATFSTLSITKVGTGYTLTASSVPLTSATSSAFTITPGPVASILVNPHTASLSWPYGPDSVQLVATVYDAYGNVEPGWPVGWTVYHTTGVLSATVSATGLVSGNTNHAAGATATIMAFPLNVQAYPSDTAMISLYCTFGCL